MFVVKMITTLNFLNHPLFFRFSSIKLDSFRMTAKSTRRLKYSTIDMETFISFHADLQLITKIIIIMYLAFMTTTFIGTFNLPLPGSVQHRVIFILHYPKSPFPWALYLRYSAHYKVHKWKHGIESYCIPTIKSDLPLVLCWAYSFRLHVRTSTGLMYTNFYAHISSAVLFMSQDWTINHHFIA